MSKWYTKVAWTIIGPGVRQFIWYDGGDAHVFTVIRDGTKYRCHHGTDQGESDFLLQSPRPVVYDDGYDEGFEFFAPRFCGKKCLFRSGGQVAVVIARFMKNRG
ncbi:MAG: hypothetical protein HOC74_06945 [Gemmatimonadetes bacterium]|jgi:hypothetical protein|nr:hypothetical protein [Gemmatimonadota bacterium]